MEMKTAFCLSVTRNRDRPAVVDGDRRLTYREWGDRVWSLGNGLSNLGLKKGDALLIGLSNCEESVTSIIAAHTIGATAVPYNPRSSENTVSYYLKDCEAKGVVCDTATLDVVLRAIEGLAERPFLVVVDPPGEVAGAHDFEQLVEGSEASEPAVTVGPHDTGLLLYTSGTTGLPKGVPITHEMSVFRILSNLNHGIAHREPLRTIGLMPLYHTVGCHSLALMSLVFGGTYYPVRAFDPGNVIDLVERERINVLFATPTHLAMILNHPSFSKEKFGSVHHALYAGSAMLTSLVERVSREITENLTHIYGNTETYMSGWYRRTAERPQMLRVGIWHDVRIIKPWGSCEDLAEIGEEGELIVNMRSPESFRGYFRKPEKTAEVCVDGWYHTGDVAHWVEEGTYQITGRMDDMIISGGENIHPAEVESYLATHPDVAEVCVVGVPDETWGQVVKAFVVRAADGLTEGELERYCRSSQVLEAWKRPRAYSFIPSLPRTPSGKVQRFLLRQY